MSGLNLDKKECKILVEEDKKFEPIFKILFENTIYLTREDVIESLNILINKWKANRPNIRLYVILNMDKIGSEHYYYYHFRKMLPKHEIISDFLPKADEDIELLFMDDWSLSGGYMVMGCISEVLENLNYRHSLNNNIDMKRKELLIINNPIEFDLKQKELMDLINDSNKKEYLKSNHKVIVTTLLPIYSEKAKLLFYTELNMYRYNGKLKIIENFNGDLKVDPLSKYLRENNIDRELEQEFYIKFSPDTENTAYPVHLDYKIANQFGSYPTIYEKCRDLVPEGSVNPEIKEEIVDYFSKF